VFPRLSRFHLRLTPCFSRLPPTAPCLSFPSETSDSKSARRSWSNWRSWVDSAARLCVLFFSMHQFPRVGGFGQNEMISLPSFPSPNPSFNFSPVRSIFSLFELFISSLLSRQSIRTFSVSKTSIPSILRPKRPLRFLLPLRASCFSGLSSYLAGKLILLTSLFPLVNKYRLRSPLFQSGTVRFFLHSPFFLGTDNAV